MLWHSAASSKVSEISQFFAFFPGTTGLILIKLWFLFMLWHSAANCKVSKFSSLFCIFLSNYWCYLDQTLIFVYAVALCSQFQTFQIFFTFWHFSQELLVSSWSNFDFCLCHSTLQPIVKFENFLTIFHFSEDLLVFIKHWILFMLWHTAASCKVSQFFALLIGSTGLILINLWFLFMLCHSTANCKIFKIFSQFYIFLKNYWSSSNFDFCSCYGILQPVAKFHKFLSFLHFSQELLVWSW